MALQWLNGHVCDATLSRSLVRIPDKFRNSQISIDQEFNLKLINVIKLVKIRVMVNNAEKFYGFRCLDYYGKRYKHAHIMVTYPHLISYCVGTKSDLIV